MIRWPMLMRRSSTFYSRVQVPLRLQRIVGHKEFLKRFRTSDPDTAKLLSLKVTAECCKLIDALDRKVTASDPVTVARDYQTRTLADDATQRARVIATDDDVEAESLALTGGLERLVNDPPSINRLLDRLILEQGLHVQPSQRPLFARELFTAEQDTLRSLLNRSDGRVTDVGPTVTGLLTKCL
jgi:hypothetical protein